MIYESETPTQDSLVELKFNRGVLMSTKYRPKIGYPITFHPNVTFTPPESVVLYDAILSSPNQEFRVRFGVRRGEPDDRALLEAREALGSELRLEGLAPKQVFLDKLSHYLQDPSRNFCFNPPTSPVLAALEIIGRIADDEKRVGFLEFVCTYLNNQLRQEKEGPNGGELAC